MAFPSLSLSPLSGDRDLIDGAGLEEGRWFGAMVFAYGGFPLLISYLGILGAGVWAIVRVTLRQRTYDGTFVALATTWLAYQLQSFISINQIGLAIWGWVLVGALVAYEYSTRKDAPVEAKGKGSKEKENVW